MVIIFFIVGAHHRIPVLYPPCEQGLTAVGTGGRSALSALCGIVLYNPASGGFGQDSVRWGIYAGSWVLTWWVPSIPAPCCHLLAIIKVLRSHMGTRGVAFSIS